MQQFLNKTASCCATFSSFFLIGVFSQTVPHSRGKKIGKALTEMIKDKHEAWQDFNHWDKKNGNKKA